jgi:hypothetical protein
MSIEAMKLALAVLKEWRKGFPDDWTDFDAEAIAALRQAIEQAEQAQPVGTVKVMGSYKGVPALGCLISADGVKVGDKLYTAPPPRKPEPLTDEQNAKRWRWAFIESPDWTYAVCKWDGKDWLPIKTEDDIKELDQAIEAALGIKENT